MRQKILITFWVPPEVLEVVQRDFEVIGPPEETTGVFTFDEVTRLLPEVDGAMVAMEPFDQSVIDLGTRLKVIGRFGVGCDSVDCEYAGRKGIAVVNTPNAVTQPTAEMTIALMLAAGRRVVWLDRETRARKQCFRPPNYDGVPASLYGKTLGIIGYGRIGKAVAHKAFGLGMRILYSDVVPAPAEIACAVGAVRVGTDELLRTADFVSLHCPYVPENHHLINADTLATMKPTAILINAARGKMVEEAALIRALRNKTIKGAALDVFEFEPKISQELLAMDNVVVTPHVASWSYDARVAMALESLDGIMAILRGQTPTNLFNGDCLAKTF